MHRVQTRHVTPLYVLLMSTSFPMSARPVLLVRRMPQVMMHRVQTQNVKHMSATTCLNVPNVYDASGAECNATLCSVNEYVSSHVCTCVLLVRRTLLVMMHRVETQNATPLYVVLMSMSFPMSAHRVLMVRLTLLVMTHRVHDTVCGECAENYRVSSHVNAHPVLLVRRTLEVMMPRVITQNATPLYVLLMSMFLPMSAHLVLLVRRTMQVMMHRVQTQNATPLYVLLMSTSLPRPM